jgi:hypothetical protein
MKYAQPATANISEQEKTFRTFISNDPVLSYFLETGSIGAKERFAKQEVYKDAAFVAFVSPYFQEAYVKAILNALDLKDTNLMSDVASNPILLDYEHRQLAFDQILVYLEEKKAKLASLHHKLIMHELTDFIELPDYTNNMTISNLNYLPGEFLEFRSSYAGVAIKVVNALCNRELNMSLNMVTNLRELTVDMQTSHDVTALYKLLNNATDEQKSLERGPEEVANFLSQLFPRHRRHNHDLWIFIGIALTILS